MAQKYTQEKKKESQSDGLQVSKRECTHPQRTKRQKSVKRCVEARAKRTHSQQLKHLDELLGKNKGAVKERARLKDKIQQSKEEKKK